MKKVASILKNKKYYRVCSYSQTVDGLWIAVPPLIKLELNVEPNILVERLLTLLSASKINVPHPNDWKAFDQEMLKNMGVKSSTEIYKNAIECDVSMVDKILTFLPTRRNGNKGRFDHLNNLIVTTSIESSYADIYEILRKALDSCE